MWTESNDMDKIAAYHTLYEALMTTIKLLAPVCPHITEEIFQSLGGDRTTVHMCDWPIADLTLWTTVWRRR
jgi:isoleucyl-tRNA synthetase